MLDLLVEKYHWKYIEKYILLDKNNIEKIDHLLLITGSSQIKDFRLPKNIKISYIIDDLHTGGFIKKKRINNHHLVQFIKYLLLMVIVLINFIQ